MANLLQTKNRPVLPRPRLRRSLALETGIQVEEMVKRVEFGVRFGNGLHWLSYVAVLVLQ